VIEVLSPSTAAIDHGQGDAIETRVVSEGAVELNPPGFEVAVEALFPPP
jgi:hypothetical protein